MCWAHFDPYPPTRQTARCERVPLHEGRHAHGDLAEALDLVDQQRERIAELEAHVALQSTQMTGLEEEDVALRQRIAELKKVVKLSGALVLGKVSVEFYLLQVANVLKDEPVSDLADLEAEAAALAEPERE